MKPGTRAALLWLAGTGGALVIFRELLGVLQSLAVTVSPVLLGTLLVLLAAACAGILAIRRRLAGSPAPLTFTENRP